MRFLIYLVLFWSSLARAALETTDVLPQGVRNLSLKFGELSGLNEAYTESGELKYLTDIKSITLSPDFLTSFNSDVEELVTLLNQFGTYEIGNQIHPGRLDVVPSPEVSYVAPMFLYGFSKKLTAGIAIPVIQFKNKVEIQQIESNIPQLQRELGGVSAELDAAFRDLGNVKNFFYEDLRKKGYKDLNPKNETFIGDVVLAAAYQFDPLPNDYRQAAQLQIGLPTGPEPDADDIADLENFHRLSIKPMWIGSKTLNKYFTLLATAAYQAILPAKIDKRVPLDSTDSLPKKEQTYKLTQDIGDIWSGSLGILFKLSESISFGSVYLREEKAKDSFAGAPDGRDRYLTQNTDRTADVMRLEFSYSSVSSYLKGQAWLPGSISYEISQVLSGENVENQTLHEVSLNVFF